MSVETNLDIQCGCGSFYRYNGEAIYTSPLKYVYKCESCYHIIYAIEKEKGKEYDSHLGYKG